MSLNQDFLTEEEQQLIEKQALTVGNFVDDGNTPETFFANPNPNEFPILLEDIKLITSLESRLDDLNDLRNELIRMNGIDRSTAASLESFVPELFVKKPLASFSTHISKTNYYLSLEEIDKQKIGIYGAIIAALIAFCWKLFSWLFGKKSSGGGDGGSVSTAMSSIANPEAVQARADLTDNTANAAAAVDAAVDAVIPPQASPEITKIKKEFMDEVMSLKESTTEGRIFSMLTSSMELQNLYKAILTSGYDELRLMLKRLNEMKDRLNEFTRFNGDTKAPGLVNFINTYRVTVGKIKGNDKYTNSNNRDRSMTAAPLEGFAILLPTVEFRNPHINRDPNSFKFIETTGVIFNNGFVDIGTVDAFLKQPYGLKYLLNQHQINSMNDDAFLQSVISFTKSGLLIEYKNSTAQFETGYEGVAKAIEENGKIIHPLLKSYDRHKTPRTIPAQYSDDQFNRQDSFSEFTPEDREAKSPGVTSHGQMELDLGADGKPAKADDASLRYNEDEFVKFSMHAIPAFFENELRYKARELTNWGSVLGHISNDISIVSYRLINKFTASQNKMMVELRKHLTGSDEKDAAVKFKNDIDARFLHFLQVVLREVKAGNMAAASHPRILPKIVDFIKSIKAPNMHEDVEKRRDTFTKFQAELERLANSYEREFSKTAMHALINIIRPEDDIDVGPDED